MLGLGSVAVPSPWRCRRDIERRAPSVRVRVDKNREEREEERRVLGLGSVAVPSPWRCRHDIERTARRVLGLGSTKIEKSVRRSAEC